MINYDYEKDYNVEYNNKILGISNHKEVLTNNSIIHSREIKQE